MIIKKRGFVSAQPPCARRVIRCSMRSQACLYFCRRIAFSRSYGVGLISECNRPRTAENGCHSRGESGSSELERQREASEQQFSVLSNVNVVMQICAYTESRRDYSAAPTVPSPHGCSTTNRVNRSKRDMGSSA